MTRPIILIKCLAVTFLISSCATFEHGWKYQVTEKSQADPETLLEQAHQMESQAATA
jgi:hypothetical protein